MDSPLNLAHQQQRKSECYLRSGKFDDAIACQVKAVEFLDEALKLTRSTKGRESLEFQKLYHNRQQDVIRSRQVRMEVRRREREAEEAKILESEQMEETIDPGGHDIQKAILYVVDEQDSLLNFLRNKPISPKTSQENIFSEAVKVPKNEQTVREELIIKSDELRRLLSIQFEVTERLQEENRTLREENKRLKQHVEDVHRKYRLGEQSVRRRPLSEISPGCFISAVNDTGSVTGTRDLPIPAPLELPRNVIRIIGASKQNLFENNVRRRIQNEPLPSDVVSPTDDINSGMETRDLPILAPLEMPRFDFSSLMKENMNL